MLTVSRPCCGADKLASLHGCDQPVADPLERFDPLIRCRQDQLGFSFEHVLETVKKGSVQVTQKDNMQSLIRRLTAFVTMPSPPSRS